MPIADTILGEFDHEMTVTRTVLERVPIDKASFRPHEKSMTLLHLATHVSFIPFWMHATLEQDELDFANMESLRPPQFTTIDALLTYFDQNVASGRAALENAKDDGRFGQPWTLRNGDQVLFTMPKAQVIRTFVLSHLIHHRGQLSVYLRMNDVPLPRVYGPSADEQ